MAKSKYHLLAKRHSGKFNPNANWFTGEVGVKNEKKPAKQGTNTKWLRTRKKIRNKILR